MRKIIIYFLLMCFAFSIDGTIVFYDGTTLEGEVTSTDTNSVFIIPNGLVLPEQISIPDIESLTLENGIVMVDDGVAKQTYKDGKFAAVEEDEPEFEEIDFEDEYEDVELTNLDYFSFNGFGGLPVYFRPPKDILTGPMGKYGNENPPPRFGRETGLEPLKSCFPLSSMSRDVRK